MSTETTETPAARTFGPAWKALIPAAIYWTVLTTFKGQELPYLYRFLYSMALPLLFFIAFSIWWWRNPAIPKGERRLVWLLLVLSPFAAAPLTDHSMGVFPVLTVGVPGLMTLITLGYVLTRPWRERPRRVAV